MCDFQNYWNFDPPAWKVTETSEKRNKCNPWLLQCFTKIFIEFSRAREQAAKPSPLPGGVLPWISRVCAAPKGRVFAPFLSENGRRFCPFFFGIGYGLRGNYDCISMCSSFQFQMNKKESLICEFDIAWVVYRRPPSLEKIGRGDDCTQASKKYFQCCNDDIISDDDNECVSFGHIRWSLPCEQGPFDLPR